MLVLTRKLGEGVIIGDGIRVMILEIRGNQVRLGIEAPTEVPVHREEVYRSILKENQEAARLPIGDLNRIVRKWSRSEGKVIRNGEDSNREIRRG